MRAVTGAGGGAEPVVDGADAPDAADAADSGLGADGADGADGAEGAAGAEGAFAAGGALTFDAVSAARACHGAAPNITHAAPTARCNACTRASTRYAGA
ncbi:hypothetical protein BN2476_20054 [Paraburkholderia piptadeniae]|uniref:Uncharacterized protein n=1 Tax=Paraburkholderia piptadeniae TaxID=1701573 RepID=A0A1N7RKC7_9BURK|nr:hypothetical protein BN2476_20054 [Paraburkholderia piptadeniae]